LTKETVLEAANINWNELSKAAQEKWKLNIESLSNIRKEDDITEKNQNFNIISTNKRSNYFSIEEKILPKLENKPIVKENPRKMKENPIHQQAIVKKVKQTSVIDYTEILNYLFETKPNLKEKYISEFKQTFEGDSKTQGNFYSLLTSFVIQLNLYTKQSAFCKKESQIKKFCDEIRNQCDQLRKFYIFIFGITENLSKMKLMVRGVVSSLIIDKELEKKFEDDLNKEKIRAITLISCLSASIGLNLHSIKKANENKQSYNKTKHSQSIAQFDMQFV